MTHQLVEKNIVYVLSNYHLLHLEEEGAGK